MSRNTGYYSMCPHVQNTISQKIKNFELKCKSFSLCVEDYDPEAFACREYTKISSSCFNTISSYSSFKGDKNLLNDIIRGELKNMIFLDLNEKSLNDSYNSWVDLIIDYKNNVGITKQLIDDVEKVRSREFIDSVEILLELYPHLCVLPGKILPFIENESFLKNTFKCGIDFLEKISETDLLIEEIQMVHDISVDTDFPIEKIYNLMFGENSYQFGGEGVLSLEEFSLLSLFKLNKNNPERISTFSRLKNKSKSARK